LATQGLFIKFVRLYRPIKYSHCHPVTIHSLDSNELTATVRRPEYVKGLGELGVGRCHWSVSVMQTAAGPKYFGRTSDIVQFYAVTSNLAIYNDYIYTGCHRRNGPNFGRVFLMLNYNDITQNTYSKVERLGR